jgi:hypothetical protein
MDLRKISNMRERAVLFQHVLATIGQTHLDFGCGNGIGTLMEAIEKPDSQIIGYDLDIRNILANPNEKNLRFCDSIEELKKFRFDSVSVNFVFHECPSTLIEIGSFVFPGTLVCILDYNLKGISERQFRKIFCADNEKEAIRKEGELVCYQKHTALGLDDCVNAGINAGFSNVLVCPSENYFVWIGRKN